jgi:hypothetical protein
VQATEVWCINLPENIHTLQVQFRKLTDSVNWVPGLSLLLQLEIYPVVKIESHYVRNGNLKKKTKLRELSPREKYTDRATTACR